MAIRIDPADALAPRPDVRLVRVSLEATSPDRALAAALAAFGSRTLRLLPIETSLSVGAALDDVLRLERAVLDPRIIIPVVHLSELYAIGPNVEVWNGQPIRPSGGWDFGAVWMRAVHP